MFFIKTRKFSWHPLYIPLAACLGLQLAFWNQNRTVFPKLDIVPPAPMPQMGPMLSFGDNEFFFRGLALNIQNFGDMFGQFTPLKNYDLDQMAKWFTVMDGLDARSNMAPAMAAYYFSQTQHPADVRYMVDYIYTHASKNVEHKWWWLVQAIYLAQHKLKDMDLAMKMAAPLVNPAVPAWAQQMAAVVHEKRGEMEDAYRIMLSIQDNAKQLDDKDLRYMRYFIDERLHKMEEYEKARGKIEIPEPAKP